MNCDRIEELYKHAIQEAGSEYGFDTTNSHVAKTFAELIVKECINQCFSDDEAIRISKHFGITEDEIEEKHCSYCNESLSRTS